MHLMRFVFFAKKAINRYMVGENFGHIKILDEFLLNLVAFQFHFSNIEYAHC